MEIHLTNNKAHEEKVRAALKKNDGYCPCAIEKTPETKCICKNFESRQLPEHVIADCILKHFN